MDANAIEQREVEVGQRRSLLILDMPAALKAGCGAACNQNRKVFVIVKAGITHAAAVQVDRVIEQRAVAIGGGLHSLEEIREQRNVERADLRYLRHLFRIVAVMTNGMVRVRDADLRIG